MTRSALIMTLGYNDFKLPQKFKNWIGQDAFQELKKSIRYDPNIEGHKKIALKNNDYIGLTDTLKELEKLARRSYRNGSIFFDEMQFSEAERLEHFKKEKLKAFPLLNPFFDALDKDNGNHIYQDIKSIYLIATEHKDDPHDNDTIKYALIVQRYLKDAASAQFNGLNDCVIEEPIILTGDADRYDQMYRELQEKFDLLKLKSKLVSFDRVYGLPTGGTPAMSAALLLVGAETLTNRFYVLYTRKSPSIDKGTSDQLFPLATGRQLYLHRVCHAMGDLIGKYNYSGALALLNEDPELVASSKIAATVKVLLGHVEARLHFNFDEAEKFFKETSKLHLISCGSTLPDFRAYYPIEWDIQPNNGEEGQLCALAYGAGAIAELFWNITLQWEADRYADYLSRLKTLTDRLNIFLLELITGVPLSYMEAVTNTTTLKGYLEKVHNGQPAKEMNLDGLKVPFNSYIRNCPFGKEADTARMVIKDILETNNPSIKKIFPFPIILDILRDGKIVKNNQIKTTSQRFINFMAGGVERDELASQILDILDLTGAFSGQKMYNLTRLRNSIPPAHAFGGISRELIIAAWDNQNPPHVTLGEALEKLNCWNELFETAPRQVSGSLATSPFSNLNKLFLELLTKLERE